MVRGVMAVKRAERASNVVPTPPATGADRGLKPEDVKELRALLAKVQSAGWSGGANPARAELAQRVATIAQSIDGKGLEAALLAAGFKDPEAIALISTLQTSGATAKPSGSNPSASAAAAEFLAKNENGTGFEINEAQRLLSALRPITVDAAASARVKSDAMLQMSGIEGKIADKLRSNGGTEHGIEARKWLVASLKADPSNQNTARAYGKMIVGMCDHNWIVKGFIQRAMGIDLQQEARFAVAALATAGITNDPLCEKLKKLAN
jgi:hypothetical protein